MKKLLFSVILLMTSICFLQAQSADTEAVKKAIESESNAFHNNPDRMAFLGYWSIADGTRMVYSGKGNLTVLTGATMKSAVENGQIPKPDNAKTTFSNYTIRVSGNVAWATFDQGNAEGKLQTHEFRCMEQSKKKKKNAVCITTNGVLYFPQFPINNCTK
jgi:hypothetical protein